ncbi:CUB and sushi domain-containing protein 1-like [Gigantopelta aegis]|uniref:CUB and sushi domain-containing protein 1-like n=1 Tax=Gigantopelta aegis TaxID=1735272 RepID=UPI001B887D8B|nr:CUB and sushi domain-containing protein 1-like [Gigantopelta aegis]
MFFKTCSINIGRNYGIFLLLRLILFATVLWLVESLNCVDISIFIRENSFSNLLLAEGRIRTHVGVQNDGDCAVRCQIHPDCKSFFFNKNSRTCQTNSVIHLTTAGSVLDEGSLYFRTKTDCPSPPLVPNSNQLFNASTVARSQGTSLQHECQTGFVPENDLTTIICQENSTWTNIVCKRPDCPSPPVIGNSNEQFVRSTVSTVYGATLQYGCKSGFVAENGVTTITCGVDATWTGMVCKRK